MDRSTVTLLLQRERVYINVCLCLCMYMHIFLYLQTSKEKKVAEGKKGHNYINSVRNYKQPGWNQSWLWIASAWSANY